MNLIIIEILLLISIANFIHSQQLNDEPLQIYSPGVEYVNSEKHLGRGRLVATKDGQLVRAYPASAFKRLRLVQVPTAAATHAQKPVFAYQPSAFKSQQRYIAQRQQPQLIYNVPRTVVSPSKLKQVVTDELEEPEYPNDPNPQYNFSFDVKDDELTNYQNRHEERDGGVIKGSYSVVDPDGYVRTVTYTADSKNGFQAKVVREPTDVKIKFPVPTQSPTTHGKIQSFKAKAPQPYKAPQIYNDGTHLQQAYVIRRAVGSSSNIYDGIVQTVPQRRTYRLVPQRFYQ